MKHHTPWPNQRESWPVYVKLGNSISEILGPKYLTTEIKNAQAKIIGVVVDADDNPTSCYYNIRQLCETDFPDLPATMPREGLVVTNDDGKRFSLWIMPNNTDTGDLETFLKNLVSGELQTTLWDQASNCVQTALSMGAECRASHIPKANLYTWLAWQDPPGRSPGESLTKKFLDPHSNHAEPFIAWFKKLYKL